MPSNHCEVCGNFTKGVHFGVKSCRACAAFFRRALLSPKKRKSCKFQGNCRIFDGEKYTCKSCRLDKCRRVGMNGDALINAMSPLSVPSIPRSVEKFVGRPSLVLFCTKHAPMQRTFVNVKNLINRGWEILKSESATPWSSDSQLQKLTVASGKFLTFPKTRRLSKVTQKDTVDMWNYDFLSTATWLTHFDEFRRLPVTIQMKMLQCVWHVWGRLHKMIQTMNLKRSQCHLENEQVLSRGFSYLNMKDVECDMSWLSRYSWKDLFQFLVYSDGQFDFDPIIKLLDKLAPSDVEITFMFGQLCFEYAGSRFPGEIREISDRFQQILANDLHNHYYETCTRTPKVVNYAPRLAQMMKINGEIQKSIRRFREKSLIARTFDVFTADYSHPEMFIDTGC